MQFSFDLMRASIWDGSSGGVLSEGGVAGHEEVEKLLHSLTDGGNAAGGSDTSGGRDAAS